MANYLCRVGFDGLRFKGTQIQPAGTPTLQGTLEKLLSTIYDAPVKIRFSSRLDAGVSARDLCFSFRAEKELDLDRVVNFLNTQGTPALRIRSMRRVKDSFDARSAPHAKEYVYLLDLGVYDPVLDSRAWPIYKPLDRQLLARALSLFEGTHDFSSFASLEQRGVRDESFISNIERIRVSFPRRGKLAQITIRGWAFHRYQVRMMVGAAVRVALGRDSLETIEERLTHPDIDAAKLKAPAEGLTLSRTIYRGR